MANIIQTGYLTFHALCALTLIGGHYLWVADGSLRGNVAAPGPPVNIHESHRSVNHSNHLIY